MRLSTLRVVALFLLAAAGSQLSAKDKHKQPPRDQISVAAHMPLSDGPIVRFTATRHYDRAYIYAERGSGQPITLLDITDPNKPVVVSELPASEGAASLIAVAGTAVISTSSAATTAVSAAQTIRLMDLSDPAHPRVTQQFENVSAVEKVSGNLTLLANPEGIWILNQRLADNPADEERYARKVIYGDSMY
jgi:hypothetical protein